MRDTPPGTTLPTHPLQSLRIPEPVSVPTDKVQPDIPSLNALALGSLRSLFDEKEHLFVERITLRQSGYRRAAISRKQTIIALLGLHRLAGLDEAQPFDLVTIREVAFQDRSWVKTAGDLGLLTWFAAECFPDRLGVVFEEFDFENALTIFADGREARAEGVAWFLAGIAHAAIARRETLSRLTDVAADSYRLLQENQGPTGIFGHSGLARFPLRTASRRYGMFSDQISAIYSLSMFAKAFEVNEPLESALACANTMCALQGDLGQWWFLYDKQACRVVKHYPVLSPHQDGTAPLGLLTLAEVTGRGFQKAIAKSLSWVGGANELGSDLRDFDQEFIWDSIEPTSRLPRYRGTVLDYLIPFRKTDANSLRIRCEARPEHFGWLLCAFGKIGLPRAAS